MGYNRALRVFLASFLVLFVEVALIRWMPAYIRLLAYFSNFILLAAFLGIGVGCLLAATRARLFAWFPLVLFALVAVVYFFRLEVTIQTSGDIFFSSGTPQKVVTVESTLSASGAFRDRRVALRRRSRSGWPPRCRRCRRWRPTRSTSSAASPASSRSR